MRGHARIGRTNVRRINPWSPGRLSGGGGHVRSLHRRLRLRVGREQGGEIKRELETGRVRYKALRRTDGQTVATVGCLQQMGQRTVEIVSVSSSPRTALKNKALDTEANEDGPWWSAGESQLIKVPTARIPVFRLLENKGVRRGKTEKKKEERIVNEGGQGARVLLQEVEANAERRSASRSTVLCRPVAMTGYDPSPYTLKKSGQNYGR